MILQMTPKGQYYVTLPKKVVEAKKWARGKRLNIVFNEKGNLEIEEVK